MAHWIYMNGSAGCMPDSISVCSGKRSAIDEAETIFGDSLPSARAVKRMRSDLHRHGIHYFTDAAEAGADYVSIEKCSCGKPSDHDPHWR